MFKEFNEYISGYFTLDAWYDDGVVIASKMLEKFHDSDWLELLNSIPIQSNDWKEKYAYSIDSDYNSKFVLKSLILLMHSEDEDVVITAVDSLRCIVDTSNVNLLKEDIDSLIEIVDKISQNSVTTRNVINDFMVKVKA